MIDPSIALQYRNPEAPDPVEGIVRGMQLRGMQTQQQLQQGQVEQQQLEMDQARRQQQEYADFKTAIARGATPEELLATSPKYGSEYNRAQLEQQKTKYEIGKQRAERLGALANAWTDQASYQAGVEQALREGLITPEAMQHLPGQFRPDVAKQFQDEAMTSQQFADFKIRQADASRAQKKFEAELPGIQAESQQKQVVAGQYSRYGMTQQQRDEMEAQARRDTETMRHNQVGETETGRHNKVDESQGAGRLSVSQQEQALRQRQFNATLGAGRDVNGQPLRNADGTPLTGDAFLSRLDPGTAAQVKAIAEGRQTQLPRGKELAGIMAMVNQYDPNFSNQRAEIRKAFTTGKAGDNIGALNTATVHLDQLADVARAMQNGTFQPGNELWNAARTMFGSALPTNFEGLKSAVAGEMANALKGNATDIEIANIAASIKKASSPEQLAGVIETHLHTLGAKLNTYAERYTQANPTDTVWTPVLPAAGAVYAKHGIQPIRRQQAPAPAAAAATTGGRGGGAPGAAPPGSVTVTDPQGGTHVFPNQAAADQFKKLARIP